MAQPSRYRPIESYGIVGDLHTVALIDRLGSIDWFCAPRFDSPSIFGRLLDSDRGGFCAVETVAPAVPDSRRYVGHTNVLETVLSTPDGRLEIIDFMVTRERVRTSDDDHILVRRLRALDADLEVRLRVAARFRYGEDPVPGRIEGPDQRCLALDHDDLHLHVDGPAAWTHEGDTAVQHLTLAAGQPAWTLLTYDGKSTRHRGHQPERLLEGTRRYWERWIGRCQYDGPYRELVLRSALVLKLLIYAPEGSIVAAPTTSLPEWIGGARNWDYRFTWLRDSAFLIYALQLLGYHEEAADFMGWLERVHDRRPADFQIMYGIDGRTDLEEQTLPHLEGYMGSRPVRVGNGAAKQSQLDIYGEVLDTAYLHLRYGRGTLHGLRDTVLTMLTHVCDHWMEKDSGIWEVRGGPQHFLYSKLMCWVALDRGLRMADGLRVGSPERLRWAAVREEIRHAILTRGWSEKLGAFRQAFDVDALDATALMIPMVRFLPARDERMRMTMDAIKRDLTDRHGFVYRYRSEDGLHSSEGSFLLCAFWMVNNLALQGRDRAARDLFEHLTSHGNDLGLFSEEVDAASRTMLGNFPQAFTHLAIVNAAAHIQRGAGGEGSARGS